jgi:hypothetical protein
MSDDQLPFNDSASSRRGEDPQNQMPLEFDDEFILTSQRTVVIDQGFDPTNIKPRFSEQIRIDLDMSSNYPGDS